MSRKASRGTSRKHVDDVQSESSGQFVPTEADIDLCEYNMTMAQLKDPDGIFASIPKSVIIDGRKIPRTALRKRDLCALYLSMGGEITSKAQRALKNWTPAKKPSPEQVKYDKLMEQRSRDHNGTKSSLKHEGTSRKYSLKHETSQGGSRKEASSTSKKQLSKKQLSGINNLSKKWSLKNDTESSKKSSLKHEGVNKSQDNLFSNSKKNASRKENTLGPVNHKLKRDDRGSLKTSEKQNKKRNGSVLQRFHSMNITDDPTMSTFSKKNVAGSKKNGRSSSNNRSSSLKKSNLDTRHQHDRDNQEAPVYVLKSATKKRNHSNNNNDDIREFASDDEDSLFDSDSETDLTEE